MLGASSRHCSLIAGKCAVWPELLTKHAKTYCSLGWHALQGSDMVWQQLQQQQDTQYESESGDNTDVPASQLADKDSLFVEIDGLNVHYKQAYPAKVGSFHVCCLKCFSAGFPAQFQ